MGLRPVPAQGRSVTLLVAGRVYNASCRGEAMPLPSASSESVRPTVSIAPNSPVFDLPVLVAIDEGLFTDAGLDVRMSARYEDREKTLTEREVLTRLKEQLFECGSADSYNVCEWASIDRLERGKRGGNIARLRAAVVAQAILSFDDALQVPRDLADV